MLLAATSVFAFACGRAPEQDATAAAITVLDGAGDTVRLAGPALRVVSLIPARTDVIVALGGADRLIARTIYDDDPRLAALPSVGNALNPSVEWLTARGPDLVVAWPDRQSRSVVARIAELGIPVYASQVETLADTRRSIRDLGELLGLRGAADSLLASIDADFESVRSAVAGLSRPKVFYAIGLESPTSPGPGTFLNELIGIAGGGNVFADAAMRWPQVGMEEIVRRDPEVIVTTVGGAGLLQRLRTLPGWRDLRAVRDGRVYAVDADLFNRPGPAVGRVARMLAELIHPGALDPTSGR